MGEVRMRVKKSQAAKQISTHLTYNNLPHHKLLRMKNREKDYSHHYISQL